MLGQVLWRFVRLERSKAKFLAALGWNGVQRMLAVLADDDALALERGGRRLG